MTEVVVSASLLVVIMGVVTPLAIRSGRMWKDTRNQELAIDEMVNQLERLTSLDADAREQAIAQLVPSPQLQAVLPDADLSIEAIVDQEGRRLVLSLAWDRSSKPLTLVAWTDPIDPRDRSPMVQEETGQ